MTEFSVQAIEQSGYLRAGFADHYDAFRPSPPDVLLDALARYSAAKELQRVVDLGSGTGLSTRAWAGRAGEVVGMEPNPKMLGVAEARTEDLNAEVDAQGILGLARSLGLVPELFALGASEEELGLTRLEDTVRAVVGLGRVRWVLGYRVRLGVKP